jgi:hypothetical protein
MKIKQFTDKFKMFKLFKITWNAKLNHILINKIKFALQKFMQKLPFSH